MESLFTWPPALRFWKESLRLPMGRGGQPSFLKIASPAVGMNGVKKCASTYTASSSSLRQIALRACCESAFIFQGSRSAIHLLVAPQALATSVAASARRYLSKAPRTEVFISLRSNGSDGVNLKSASGMDPPHSVTALWTRLPSLSQRSALCMSLSESSLNFRSSPYSASLHKNQRSVSVGYRSSWSCGSTTFPKVLDIFRPSGPAINPWTTTLFGIGRPTLISMDGHMTQWNQQMSLPMTCMSAGQKRLSGFDLSWPSTPLT
mmetsp:Transcript_57697/g.149952  ORF Transcript_57697/g.149952 Transcript_57697/m.149952 type:complete len:263 (+) Transcript_57697:753-1541(+)